MLSTSFGSPLESTGQEEVTLNYHKGSLLDAAQPLHQSFVYDSTASSDDSNFSILRAIRNFVIASPMNKQLVLKSNMVTQQILNFTSIFNHHSNEQLDLKREVLALYSSLLSEASSFAESLLSKVGFMECIVEGISLDNNCMLFLLEAYIIFLKNVFCADSLSQDLNSCGKQRQKIALAIFTEERLGIILLVCKKLIARLSSLDQSEKNSVNLSIICLFKLLSLIATDQEIAVRLHKQGYLQLAHQTVMASVCQNCHSNTLILNDVTPVSHLCPNWTIFNAGKFSLKLIFFILYRVTSALSTFKHVFLSDNYLPLLSCYTHMTTLCPRRSQHMSRHSSSDSTIYKKAHVKNKIPLNSFDGRCDKLLCVPVTSGKSTDILVGLLRGVILWRLLTMNNQPCSNQNESSSFSTQRSASFSYFTRSCRKKARIRNKMSAKYSHVTAVDRFGCEIQLPSCLPQSDEDIFLQILFPLTEPNILFSGSRLSSWSCDILFSILNQNTRLHQRMLYTNIFLSPTMNNKVLLTFTKLMKSDDDLVLRENNLEYLISITRLLACLSSTQETLRVKIGELEITKIFIDFLVTHPSLDIKCGKLGLCLTSTLCELIHALSRSVYLLYVLFQNKTILEFLLQASCYHLNEIENDNMHATILLSISSALINLQSCQLPFIDVFRIQITEHFKELATFDNCSLSKSLVFALQLNGVWGLSVGVHAAESTCKRKIADILTPKLIKDLINHSQSLISTSFSPLFETQQDHDDDNNNVMFIESDLPVDVEKIDSNDFDSETLARSHAQFIHKCLLLIQNLLFDKKVSKRVVNILCSDFFTFITVVCSSNAPSGIKEEALLTLSNLLVNKEARYTFWRQSELFIAISSTVTANSDVDVKAALLLTMFTILDTYSSAMVASSSFVELDSPEDIFRRIFNVLSDDGRFNHRRQKSRLERFHRSQFPMNSLTSVVSDDARSVNSHANDSIVGARYPLDASIDTEVDTIQTSVFTINRSFIPESNAPLAVQSSSDNEISIALPNHLTDLFQNPHRSSFSRRRSDHNHLRIYRRHTRDLSPDYQRFSELRTRNIEVSGFQPSTTEPSFPFSDEYMSSNLIALSEIIDLSAELSETETQEATQLTQGSSVNSFSADESEKEAEQYNLLPTEKHSDDEELSNMQVDNIQDENEIDKENDGNDINNNDKEINSSILKFLRCLFSVLIEMRSNSRLRDVWNWQLLRADSERGKRFAHRVCSNHRLSLGLQLLVPGNVSSLKEFLRRFTAAISTVRPSTQEVVGVV